MKINQRLSKVMLFFMLSVGVLYTAGGTGLASMSPPYEAVSQDGSTVIGYVSNGEGHYQAMILRNGMQTTLGTLGGLDSFAAAVSAEGAVVVGNADTIDDNRHAFLWDNGHMTDLGTLGGNSSYAQSVSADGMVVAGASVTADGEGHAFRWTDGSMTDLGTLGGIYSHTNAMSANGAVVVGDSETDSHAYHAFLWTDGTMVDLGTLGGSYSSANDVSADGAVVVGSSQVTADVYRAFRWVDGQMTDLGTLGGGNSSAIAVSADGAVVVGNVENMDSGHRRAFRWVDGRMIDLGTFGGNNSYADSVSADGTVVVGWAETEAGRRAFRWDESNGMLSIEEWLGQDDVSLAGWMLARATGVSGDGSVLIGYGFDPDGKISGWMARRGALIDPQQWLGTASGARQIFHTGLQLSSIAMYGSHHRPLMSYDQIGSGLGFWVTGDVGKFEDDRDMVTGSGEVGLYNDYVGGRLRAGLGLGYSGQRQDLPLAGSTDLDGGYLIGEANWLVVPETQLIASVTALYGRWDAEVKRGYDNGSEGELSVGDTDVQSASIRLKVDWQGAAQLGPVRFDPYAGLTFTHTRVDSYTETTGRVPARFDVQKHDAQELRIGVAGVMSLSEALRLRVSVEGIERFDDSGPALSGQDVGGFGINFDLPGDDIRNSWVRGEIDVDYTLNDSSLISMNVNGASRGEDPDISGALSFRQRF